MERVKMPYRIYRQRYAGCNTLDDYNPKNKTITVIIPDRKRTAVDTTIWRKIGQGWALIADPRKDVRQYGSGVASTWQATWPGVGSWDAWHTRDFASRDEAMAFLVSLDAHPA